MKPLDRIAENRRSRRSYFPDRAAVKRMQLAAEALCNVENARSSKNVKFEARRMYIVALCASFEMFWRDTLKAAIDEALLGERDLLHLTKVTFSIADIASMAGRKVTLGELIAHNYTFQSSDAVFKAFGEVFQIDVKKIIAEHERVARRSRRRPIVTVARDDDVRLTGKDALRCEPSVCRCFRIRHETVHNLGFNYRLSLPRMKRLAFDTWFFCKFSSMALLSAILPRMVANRLRDTWSTGGPTWDKEKHEALLRPVRNKVIVRGFKGSQIGLPMPHISERRNRRTG